MPNETPNKDPNKTAAAEAPEGAGSEPQTVEDVSLKQKLGEAESKLNEALRTMAEYDNARKRQTRDIEVERKYAHTKFATDLLMALDNLDRAVSAAKQAGDNGPLVQGVIATQMQIRDALKRHGIIPIPAKGEPFDPHKHEAVQMQPTADQPANTVVQVLQEGFLIHDRVLRPATVVIASAPEK